MYKTLVVGRGLIGSAAGRHLTGLQDGVAILGPDEPADRATHQGVFASHYDEGRMTRIVDPDPNWAITAKRSIERYPEIEAESGISFFTEAGYLGIGQTGAAYIEKSKVEGAALGADIEALDADSIRKRFPFLAVGDGQSGLYEKRRAGYLSPRRMVRAQTEAARKRGAEIIVAEATAIRPVTGGVEIETADGGVVRAERVLIATGAFTDACGLSGIDLGLRVFGRTVVLARVEGKLADALRDMPTMGHAETGAYILPPIRYPDGHAYLKIGIGSQDDPEPETLSGLKDWFKGAGSEENRRAFPAFLKELIPCLAQIDAWHSDTCLVTWTKTGLPHIDFVDGERRVAVAVGGNGKGAKSADDWGWMAAHLIAGRDWEHPVVSRDALKLPA